MKQISLLLAACLLWTMSAVAQTWYSMPPSPADSAVTFEASSNAVLRQLYDYYPDNPARAEKMHGRWHRFWQSRFTQLTETTEVNPYNPTGEGNNVVYAINYNYNQCLANAGGNWYHFGPKISYFNASKDYSGRVISVWTHKDNLSYMLAGSSSGGLFKTVNGGLSWENITDNASHLVPGTLGVPHIAVNPNNHDQIFIVAGISGAAIPQKGWWNHYTLGIMYSTDGGNTWNSDNQFKEILEPSNLTTRLWETNGPIPQLAFSQYSGYLYAIYKGRAFRRSPAHIPIWGNQWTEITPTSPIGGDSLYIFNDFCEDPQQSGKIIFATNCVGNTQLLYRYDENSESWESPRSIVVPNRHNNKYTADDHSTRGYGVGYFTLYNADFMYMNLLLSDTSNVERRVLASYNWATNNLTVINDTWTLPDGAVVPSNIVVSPVNSERLYVTDNTGYPEFLFKSENGGATFSNIATTHADGRALQLVHAAPNNNWEDDIIFCGTDGGVSFKPTGTPTFVSRTGEGLYITEFWGLSSNPANSNMMAAGAIDNHTQGYLKTPAASLWDTEINGGDGLAPAFARNGVHTAFTMSQSGLGQISTFNTTTNTIVGLTNLAHPGESHATSWLRPWRFTKDNDALLGYFFMWRKQGVAPTDPWDLAFKNGIWNNEPQTEIDNHLDSDAAALKLKHEHKKVLDFFVSEKYPNVGYLAYFGIRYKQTDLNESGGKFYYTTELDETTQPVEWKASTLPSDVHPRFPITDIEVDPVNPNRVWVALGGVEWPHTLFSPADRVYRVYYHANHGNTDISSWIDVSKGLPTMPITKLLYIEGSDDVLFAATDVGVFRWNKAAQQWECFNTGLPRGLVTDIEMNYCSGKLRVSLYGRGIWETDYDADVANMVPGDSYNTISSNTTWNSSLTLSSSVRVKTGNTLTISGAGTTIYMPRNGRIFVEKGAKLIIDNATITNECGVWWKGIQLEGDNTQPPVAWAQGSCEIRNGARLINAMDAIWNCTPDNGWKGGGIILAKDCEFINCWRAVGLHDYDNFSYVEGGSSKCQFENVDFIYRDGLLKHPGCFFTSWFVRNGVEIVNCRFKNEMTTLPPYMDKGMGIWLGRTGIAVRDSWFNGLGRGIGAEGFAFKNNVVLAYNNFFTYTDQSIKLKQISFGDIKSNNIMVPPSKGAFGIYLDTSFQTYIGCQNQISGSYYGQSLLGGELGLLINSTGHYSNKVVNNEFRHLPIALQSQKNNTNVSIACNQFRNNGYAWVINPQSTGDFFCNQGSYWGPALNTFDNSAGVDINSFTSNSWTYYTSSGALQTPTISGAVTIASGERDVACLSGPCQYYNQPADHLMTMRAAYDGLLGEGKKYTEEGEILYQDLVKVYTVLDDDAGLIDFLEEDNEDRSRKVLLHLYIAANKFTDAQDAINALTTSGDEKDAFHAFYSIVNDLHVEGRSPKEITVGERATLTGLAAETLEVSPFAALWLATIDSLPIPTIIEDLPSYVLSKNSNNNNYQFNTNEDELLNGPSSYLGSASPNPARDKAVVKVNINASDAAYRAKIVVKSVSGGLMFTSETLPKGKSEVKIDLTKLPAGIYYYSLIAGERTIQTRKLSVTR